MGKALKAGVKIMSLSKYTIPQINWIESCLISSLLFFFLPIGIVLIGYFWIQKRKINNKPTKLVKIIITISELIALIPIIGITFFAEDGARKWFILAQGLEWTGGDSIDDYC